MTAIALAFLFGMIIGAMIIGAIWISKGGNDERD